MQELVSGEFWLKISIGGREVFAVNNQLPTEFSSVKVEFFFSKVFFESANIANAVVKSQCDDLTCSSLRNVSIFSQEIL